MLEDIVSELSKKLLALIPSDRQTLEHGLSEKFQQVMQMTFSQLNLVTREEFEIQKKVLLKTREKLETLQAQVNHLLSSDKII